MHSFNSFFFSPNKTCKNLFHFRYKMLYKAIVLLLVSDKQRKSTTFTLRIFLISAQREKQMKNYKQSSIQKLHIHIPKD